MAIGECKSTLISFAIYILVIAASATIMMFVERAGLKATALNGEQQRPSNVTKRKLNLTYHIKTHLNKHGSQKWEDSDVANLLAEITRFKVTASGHDKDWRRTLSWKTFSTWEYYVVVTVSTIGYGDITPRTGGGKIFSILVMIIGIPVNMYMFVSIAGLLSKAVMCMKNGAARLICRSSGSSGPDMICFFICIIIALIYLIVGGIGIGLREGWRWYDGIYWSCVSASTVGYGDIIPNSKPALAFAYCGIIIIIMPVFALVKALQNVSCPKKQGRLMAEPCDV